ncbi:MAG: hypothetical protein ABI831_15715 [Betaproteobacteria bacterium]
MPALHDRAPAGDRDLCRQSSAADAGNNHDSTATINSATTGMSGTACMTDAIVDRQSTRRLRAACSVNRLLDHTQKRNH